MSDGCTMWRTDAGTKIGTSALVAIASWAIAHTWGSLSATMIMLAMLFSGLVGGYMSGPAARVTVTPTHVIVFNPFERILIPHHLIGGWDRITGTSPARLVVSGIDMPVEVTAFRLNKTFMSGPTYKQWVLSRMERLDLERGRWSPPPSTDKAVRRRRYDSVVLVVAAIIVAVAAIANIHNVR